MSKIANGNVVYSGWLVKSPPESKYRLSGPWKIFRSFSQDAMDTSKWKRRFFVLFKPQGSLPHQYVLNYYNNEDGKKLKGFIDLEHCEQIIESLDLDLFPFLLAIKTYHKNRERTYFLAADTEEQMATWVRNLCSVCGLKPEDNSPDLPPQREDESDTFTTIGKVPSPITVTKQPKVQPVRNVVPDVVQSTRKNSVEEYVPLTQCSSGKGKLNRLNSIDSVPDEPAPPPPQKTGPLADTDNNDNEVFIGSVYDKPPKSNLHRTVPTPKINDSMLDVYDVPPPGHPPRHSPTTPRSSSSESHKGLTYDYPPSSMSEDSAYSSQTGLTYDHPPSVDDAYDYPPPKMDDVPPVRPPPPQKSQQQEPYQNIPPNSKMLTDIKSLDINKVVPMSQLTANVPLAYDFPTSNMPTSMYDFPKPGQSSSQSNLLIVPPPASCASDSHNYINAATSRVSSKIDEDMYLPMNGVVPVPADRMSSASDTKSHDSYTTMSEFNVYDHPPPQRPPRCNKPKSGINGDTYTIYKNERTRSFKKYNTINDSPNNNYSGGRRRQNHSVALPMNTHPDLTTSSEDEGEERIAEIDKVMVPYPYEDNHQKGWDKVPPIMRDGKEKDTELKYVELDLDDQSPNQSIHIGHSEPGMSTPTEYREIDFVKTTALHEVKKTVEVKRKHDDN